MIIIVGQGLLGTLLVWEFIQLGYTSDQLIIIDKPEPQGAWQVGAGIINSISGQAMNTSDRLDEFYPVAVETYERISHLLKQGISNPKSKSKSKIAESFYTDCGLVRCLTHTKQIKRWHNRITNYPQRYQPWLSQESELQLDHRLADLQTYFKEPLLGIVSCTGGWVDMVTLIQKSRNYFKEQGFYKEMVVNATDIQAWQRGENHQGIKANSTDKIILTQGVDGLQANDSVFGEHRSALGEILTLRIENSDVNTILNWGPWLLPINPDKQLYRFGATYQWDWREGLASSDIEQPLKSLKTSQQGRDELEARLQEKTSFDYQVIDHHVGIRPIVRRSQPVFKQVNNQLIAINGLGSKGTLYAPKLAADVVNYILQKQALDCWYNFENTKSP